MKTLDVHALYEGIQHTIEKLDKQKQQLEKLEKSVEHLAGMKDALKGKGGDAIRTFYEECHKPFLLFFGMFIDEYKKVLKQTQHAISSVESDSHGMIAEAFLSHDARHGVKHAREVTEQLTDAVNRQTSAIGHIVSLPTVNDSFFRLETEQAERLISDTLNKLFQFDGQQTQALETPKSDLQTMKKYIDQLETMYTGPKIEITGYKSGSIMRSQEEENINQTFGAINPQMKQADDSPMEMMLKKLGEKEGTEVDSLAAHNRLEQMIKSQKVTKKVYSEEDIKKLQKIYKTIDGITYCAYIDGNIIVKIECVDESPEPDDNESDIERYLEMGLELFSADDWERAALGFDPHTHEKLSLLDRFKAGVNITPPAKVIKWIRRGNKLAKVSKKAEKATDEVSKVEKRERTVEKVAKGKKKNSKSASKVKFSEMTADKQIKIAKEYSKRAPIRIPDAAKIKAQSKTDYEQITYKWNDGTYKYEVRWHTSTPGAPKNQGNTWVVQKTVPGNGGQQPQRFFKIGENEWVEGHKWFEAIRERKAGTATKDQLRILEKGHWKD
ncbi:T7SS effector LXG polymorphic toxin [Bacillus halotolerans]|uniref:T7SS effector LXG polymorphic toxin n=1 Tax=Bacillus halotolerans TaxID=260554 RepID=UPI00403F5AFB